MNNRHYGNSTERMKNKNKVYIASTWCSTAKNHTAKKEARRAVNGSHDNDDMEHPENSTCAPHSTIALCSCELAVAKMLMNATYLWADILLAWNI